MDKKTLWESTLAELQLNLSTANFQTWFKGKTAILSWQEDLIEIGCNSSYVKGWIESRYQGQIKSILDKVTGKDLNLVFTVSPQVLEQVRKKSTKYAKTNYPQSPPLFIDTDRDLFEEALSKARLNPSFNFDNFVVGKSNQLAYAVAKAIAEPVTKMYNPFFVFGGVGVGKTHLIQAIAQDVLSKNTNLKVLYCSCEDFTNDLVTSIQTKTTGNFRNKYRNANMLLIDDVQFLSGRESTQEEVFHTFNALFAAGKQIVLTSDRSPVSINKLAERLRSRFEGGMIAEIGRPDIDLREAVLLQKCKARNINLPSQIIRLLAESFPSNIRDLEGGLIRLLTYSKMKGQQISTELVKEVVGLVDKSTLKEADPNLVLEEVAKFFSVSVKDIKGKGRQTELVFPRQIVMYLLRNSLDLPLAKIATLLNRSDHTGVIYSVNKIKLAMNESSEKSEMIEKIRERIFT